MPYFSASQLEVISKSLRKIFQSTNIIIPLFSIDLVEELAMCILKIFPRWVRYALFLRIIYTTGSINGLRLESYWDQESYSYLKNEDIGYVSEVFSIFKSI
jgi:hypothetical protein